MISLSFRRAGLLSLAPFIFGALSTNSVIPQLCHGQNEVQPTIDDFAWIAGHWRGNALGGEFEETWNPPLGGTMVGMFKLAKDDGIAFHEILTIMKIKNRFVLRLKHFDENLKGWEAKDEWEQFPLKSVTSSRAIFDGLRFERVNADQMKIVVRVEEGNEATGKKAVELTFDCKRMKH
ncbi:MAG: DUF6265 family protein [Aureliella sp.]